MKALIATLILLGLGTGLGVAQGDSGGLYAYETMRQVQSGNAAAHIGRNGKESFFER